MHRVYVVAAIVFLAVLIYVAYVCITAWLEVKSSPREEMLLCAKHGPIRQNGTIDFFGQKYCGLCFHEKLNAAERGIPQ